MRILIINCGSSSLKFRLYDLPAERELEHGEVERLGQPEARASLSHPGAEHVQELPGADVGGALRWALAQIEGDVDAVGHRVVHGGERLTQPARLTGEVIGEIERCAALAPLHNPPNLAGIRACQELLPHVPQVAVFDTAFHATLPPPAYRYAVPERFYRERGVRRYGFHGTSHQYVTQRAAALLGRSDARIVSFHLGNGCSACAVRAGQSIETSMGFTPTEGLVMGTRTGDVDPALISFLLQWEGLTPEGVERLLNREAGLLALSGAHSDMRDLEAAAAAGDERSQLALAVFDHRCRKYLGAYAAVLEGLDAVVFTAGIGEHSAARRAAVCAGFGFLGIELDPIRNEQAVSGEHRIDREDAPVRVFVIPTNEELMIARETARLLAA